MIDFLHLPKPQNGTIDYFPGFSSTEGGQWEVWNKPRGANFIYIIAIGGGSGGGSGSSSATTTSRGGGGGGPSAVVSNVMLPAIFLPDRLYISSGVGGSGGFSSNNGNIGVTSFVSIAPSTSAIYVVCQGTRTNFGGNAGTTVQGGLATSSGPASNISSAYQGLQGNYTSLISNAGVSGGFNSNGTSASYPTTGLLLSGGAGGAGGAGFAGGNITAPASQTETHTIFSTLPGGVGGTSGSLAGGAGAAGINNMELLLFTGGSGGGSGFDGTAGSVGGRGGDGGIGCGGGGGGGGTTGGRGGNGGPGLVIISSW